MKVLVTGATGFLGHWICKRLVESGDEVIAFARSKKEIDSDLDSKVQFAYGDVTDLESLHSATSGVDEVFHLAGVIGYRPSQHSLMFKVNVQGTENVIKACEKAKVKKLVYLSSVVAIGAGFSPNQILNENSPYNLEGFDFGYFDSKHRAENLVVEATKKGHFSSVILNPSTIYGGGDALKGSRSSQVKVAQGKLKFYPGGGASIVAVEDVIDGIMAARARGRSGERYILSGENLLLRDVFTLIATAAGKPPPYIKVPNFVFLGLARIGDVLTKCGMESSLSYENAKVATLFHWFDCTKAKTELGFKPRPAKFAIENSVKWMKENNII